MTLNLPKINMSSVQAADVQQEYYLLFKHMMQDFLTKADFLKMIAMAIVSTPAGPGTITIPDQSTPFAEVKRGVYEGLANAGGAVRQKAIAGAEKITAEK